MINFANENKIPENINNILQEFVERVNNILGARVRRIILYGSYAKGEEETSIDEISDIDIMILADLSNCNIKNIINDIVECSYNLNLKYDVLLSPIVENFDTFNQRTSYIPFYQNIQEEGIVINE